MQEVTATQAAIEASTDAERKMELQELDTNDLALLTEALHRLRQVKVEAHAELVKVPGHESFTPADFGVPKIDALLAKADAVMIEKSGALSL